MWILERADARDADAVVSCPDTDTTGVAPQWRLTLRPEPAVWCDVDVVVSELLSGSGATTFQRSGGDQLVVVGREGTTVVSDARGAWERSLGPDDVLVLEGDEGEHYRCSPTDDGVWVAVHLRAATATPLRWIP